MLQMIQSTGQKPIPRGCGWPSSKRLQLPQPLRLPGRLPRCLPPWLPPRLPRLALLSVIVLGSTWPGCVVPTDHADSEVAGIAAEALPVTGVYWLEIDGENVTAYPIDNVRADETLTLSGTAWYAGPGWYELNDDGDWTARVDLSDLTLDDVLQVQNPVRTIP